MILCERPKKKVTIFLANGNRLFAVCRAANTKLLCHWLENIRNMCPAVGRNAAISEQAMAS